MTDEDGRLQANLAWTPLDPGYGMLHRMAMPVLLGMLLLVAIAAIELRRIFRAARQLIERERLAHSLAFDDSLINQPDWNEPKKQRDTFGKAKISQC